MEIGSLIELISNLPLKAALAALAANKIYDLSAKGYESLRKVIHDKVSEKKFGFAPNKEELNILNKIAEKEYFKEFGVILPNHPYSDFIRVGYLISYLNKIGGESNRIRVEQIRSSVALRPNGHNLIKIVNLVSTGAIVPVVDYLFDLKKKKYELVYIMGAFDEIILEWKQYTYFVQVDTPVQKIIDEIKSRIVHNRKLIMCFSYGHATGNCILAVAQLLKDTASDGKYFYESKNSTEGDKEVHCSTFKLID